MASGASTTWQGRNRWPLNSILNYGYFSQLFTLRMVYSKS
jgi:hypothetical protein